MKNLKIISNEFLSKHTYFKLGGPADMFTLVRSAAELEGAVRWAERKRFSWFILGGGSNILVGDLGFRGLVIKNEARGLSHRGTVVTAESGVLLNQLVSYTIGQGLGGLEVFISVPGTVGGAVYNNSHFRPEKDEFIGNLVESAEVLIAKELTRERVDRTWFEFGYDYSRLQQERAVVLTVDFRLKKADSESLKKLSFQAMRQRNESQPIGEACSGCVFKNPKGRAAGRLIDEAGFKGARVGGAYVSEKHANFIINDGSASSRDVLELINRIIRRVEKVHQVRLEPEIFLVGEFD